MVTGPKTVIDAIAAGKRAAVSIERYLNGQDAQWTFPLPQSMMYMKPDVKLNWR